MPGAMPSARPTRPRVRSRQETFADGTSYIYAYDDRGNLTSATDAQNRVTTFVYGVDLNNPNDPDLLTEVEYPDGTFLKFTYDAGGRRIRSVDQTGFTVNYTYDALGRLSKLTDGSGNLIVQYTYDAAGNLVQKDMGNGTRTVYTYDGDGDVLSITNYAPDHTTVNSFDDYTYDALGNVLTDTNQDGAWNYTYDADGQLVHAVFTLKQPRRAPAQDLQYVYDAAGNRISETVNGVVTTYVTNNVNEYTSSTTVGVGTTTYQYDLDGNLIAKTDHHRYTLIVDGTAPDGVTNTLGLLLDGTDSGRPDSNYRAPLTWRNLVLEPPASKTDHPLNTPAGTVVVKSRPVDHAVRHHKASPFARSLSFRRSMSPFRTK